MKQNPPIAKLDSNLAQRLTDEIQLVSLSHDSDIQGPEF
jgi:hypothetical protein